MLETRTSTENLFHPDFAGRRQRRPAKSGGRIDLAFLVSKRALRWGKPSGGRDMVQMESFLNA